MSDDDFTKTGLIFVVVAFVCWFLLAPSPKAPVPVVAMPPKPVVNPIPTNIAPLNKQDLETVREFLKP